MSESLQIKEAFPYLEFLNGCLPCVSTPSPPHYDCGCLSQEAGISHLPSGWFFFRTPKSI